jgi:hypothetical protein
LEELRKTAVIIADDLADIRKKISLELKSRALLLFQPVRVLHVATAEIQKYAVTSRRSNK